MAKQLFEGIQADLLKPFEENLNAVLGTVSGKIGPAFAAAMTIYVIWEAYQITLGRHHELMADWIRKLMKLGFIAAFVLNADVYRIYVVEPAVNLGPDLVSQLVTSTSVPGANQFDAMFNEVSLALTAAWKGVGWSAPGAAMRVAVWSGILLVVAFIAITFAFVYVTVIKVCVYMALLLGPVFIAGLMFQTTAPFFMNFVSVLVTLGIHQVLVSAFMGMFISVAKRNPEAADVDLLAMTIPYLFLWFTLPGIVVIAQSLGRSGGWPLRRAGGGSPPTASDRPWEVGQGGYPPVSVSPPFPSGSSRASDAIGGSGVRGGGGTVRAAEPVVAATAVSPIETASTAPAASSAQARAADGWAVVGAQGGARATASLDSISVSPSMMTAGPTDSNLSASASDIQHQQTREHAMSDEIRAFAAELGSATEAQASEAPASTDSGIVRAGNAGDVRAETSSAGPASIAASPAPTAAVDAERPMPKHTALL